MKKLLFVAAVAASMLIAGCSERQQLKKSLKSALEVAVQHEKAQAEVMLPREGEMPKTFEKGELVTANIRWWTSGFFPGSLWLLYEHTGDEELRQYAEQFTSRLESLKDYTGTHDLGFMVFCSYGNGYRLTGNEAYKAVINQASVSLATRFNETVGCIRSWNTGRKERPEEDYIVIIDNMMNLEMLEWSGYHDLARKHADTTIANHFRDDYSTYHVVTYNELTGAVTDKRTAQGDADDSAWARGQAWGLYGYTMMYRVTGLERYLEQAVHIADYLINPGYGVADPFMCLADFESYKNTHDRAISLYPNQKAWNKMSINNIAGAGEFAADRSIEEYAQRIWHLNKVVSGK